MAAPISVRGGANGIEAHYDDMTALARLFGRSAADTGGAALALHGYLVHPDVLASAALDPAGAATFEMQLLAALDGPSGVTCLAARCAAADVSLRGAAAAYLTADRLDERFAPQIDAVRRAPKTLYDGAASLARRDPGGAWQKVIADDPWLADLGVGATAAVLSGGSPGGGARLFSRLFGDGVPHVAVLGRDDAADMAGPPRNLAGLLAGLAWRDDGAPGEVDVRFLDPPDGIARRVIVDVPGTKSWSLGLHNLDVTSVATNLRAIGGEVTSYERGVVGAMRMAGVHQDDDVLIVGHSEGGMVAVNTARRLTASGEFHVRHVVTAGAPIGLIAADIPPSVAVLALENDADVVPHLDDAANPDRVNVLTVTAHHDRGSISANHDLRRSYLPAARDVDASHDRSVREYLAGPDGISGFLDAATVRTYAYRITRSYD